MLSLFYWEVTEGCYFIRGSKCEICVRVDVALLSFSDFDTEEMKKKKCSFCLGEKVIWKGKFPQSFSIKEEKFKSIHYMFKSIYFVLSGTAHRGNTWTFKSMWVWAYAPSICPSHFTLGNLFSKCNFLKEKRVF